MVVLWELRTVSGIPANCAYQHIFPAVHVVRVVVGKTEWFREEHSTESDANAEAAYLLDHFLTKGWSELAYRDPRIAHL